MKWRTVLRYALTVTVSVSVAVIGFRVYYSPTTINFNDSKIERLMIVTGGSSLPASREEARVPESQVPTGTEAETIVENGGFEEGSEGWGTGWFEGQFTQPSVTALGFNGAVARWSIDDRLSHSGRRSLRVEHSTPYSPNVFSSFSQRIKVKPWHRYEVKFWAYPGASDKGAFSLRVLPSRNTRLEEWDRFKGKLDPHVIGQWQEVHQEFKSGSDRFFDLRFAAEAPLKVWVDDVSVTSLGAASQ